MKVIRIFICVLAACALTASAASIEQVLEFNVTGWYQGISTNVGALSHDRSSIFRISSANIVHALVIDRAAIPNATNFYRGFLIYKTPLDSAPTNGFVLHNTTNQVVIRVLGKPDELDVTDAFTFTNGPFVIDQVANTNAMVTNSYIETGLLAVSLTTSSISFTNSGFSEGTATRTKKLVGAGTNGYTYLLNYNGGGGTFSLNTNIFYTTNFQFAGSNLVSGPATIGVKTFGAGVFPF